MTTKTKRPPPSHSEDRGFSLDGEVCDPSLAMPDNSLIMEQMKQEQMSMAEGLAGTVQGVLDMVANGSDRERAAPGEDTRKVPAGGDWDKRMDGPVCEPESPMLDNSLMLEAKLQEENWAATSEKDPPAREPDLIPGETGRAWVSDTLTVAEMTVFEKQLKFLDKQIQAILDVGPETSKKILAALKAGKKLNTYDDLIDIGIGSKQAIAMRHSLLDLKSYRDSLTSIEGIGDGTAKSMATAIAKGEPVSSLDDLKKLGIRSDRAALVQL